MTDIRGLFIDFNSSSNFVFRGVVRAEGPRVNFEMREVLSKICTWTFCFL